MLCINLLSFTNQCIQLQVNKNQTGAGFLTTSLEEPGLPAPLNVKALWFSWPSPLGQKKAATAVAVASVLMI